MGKRYRLWRLEFRASLVAAQTRQTPLLPSKKRPAGKDEGGAWVGCKQALAVGGCTVKKCFNALRASSQARAFLAGLLVWRGKLASGAWNFRLLAAGGVDAQSFPRKIHIAQYCGEDPFRNGRAGAGRAAGK